VSPESAPPPRFREAPLSYLAAGALLLVTMVALLAVPTYAHLTPTLDGIPFFYWYTLLWLVINAVLQVIAYQVLTHRRRRGRTVAKHAS
jgi:hypothetical protein